MTITPEILFAIREFAESETQQYGIPIPVHLALSAQKAVELAQKLNADPVVSEAGALLMDCKLGQALKEGRLDEHAAWSARAARELLERHNVDKGCIDKIANCAEAHHGVVPYSCLESEICANADCYRFLHPRGFFAYLVLLGSRMDSFDEALEFAKKKVNEKQAILSLDIVKKELESCTVALKQYIDAARKG